MIVPSVLISLSIFMVSTASGTEMKVGFLGNSIQYFNDCPVLLEQMFQSRFDHVQQNSCLRGGATLQSLLDHGNGMQIKYRSIRETENIGAASVEELLTAHQWDFVVINDYTQSPARQKTRDESLAALKQHYAPLLKQANATPVFLQTAAYRMPTKGSDDLGSVHEFTKHLEEGYKSYVELLADLLPEDKRPILAPVGQAFLNLHDTDHSLWDKLLYVDNFHPSPHGTWLQACVIYSSITKEEPPQYNKEWWKKARYMMPYVQLDLPTPETAETLRQLAVQTVGLKTASQC